MEFFQTDQNVVTCLKIRCAQAGTNLTRICEIAGVDRDLLTRWQKQEPKTFKIYRKLVAAIVTTEADKTINH